MRELTVSWHEIGWRKYALADEQGCVLAQVEDGSSLATSYVTGRGLIGSYLNVAFAKAAAEAEVTRTHAQQAQEKGRNG